MFLRFTGEILDPLIYVVDDDEDVREQIESVLVDAGYNVKSFARAEPFLDVFEPERPGCLVLDERMPGLRGTQVLEKVRKWLSMFPVLLVTGFADVPLAVAVMQCGAFDVVEKPFSSKDLVSRVKRAVEYSKSIWDRNREDAQNWAALQTLTPRETEILSLILEGHSSRTVGAKLTISPRTVDNHRVHIMTKLRAKSLGDLGRAVTRAKTIFGSDNSWRLEMTVPVIHL